VKVGIDVPKTFVITLTREEVEFLLADPALHAARGREAGVEFIIMVEELQEE
jgi:hypothetical protein